MSGILWPIIWPTPPADGVDPAKIEQAEHYAIEVLRMLTLYRVGQYEVTVMPCSAGCAHPLDPGMPFHPIILDDGNWANCWCHDGCGCNGADRVYLKGPVSAVSRVQIGGTDLAPGTYAIEDGTWLVRLDGGSWPSCSGRAFTVTYTSGATVPLIGQLAGGVLAAEFLKLLTNAKGGCRLPASLTTLNRQGVSMTFETGMFVNGLTNIHEVDLFIKQWNPYAMKTAPTVWSPDVHEPHQQTWGA